MITRYSKKEGGFYENKGKSMRKEEEYRLK